MKKLFIKTFAIITALTLCIVMAGCNLLDIFNFDLGDKGDLPNSGQTSSAVQFEQQTEGRTLYADYSDVAPKLMRSVVVIAVEYTVDGSTGKSFGSGVILEIDDNYYVVTCHHVISSGGNITVYIPDENCRNYGDSDYNQSYALTGKIESDRVSNQNNGITLVGGDKNSDIALLKLNIGGRALDIVTAPVPANGYQVKYAEKVFAIGNPSGELPMTFMGGNISYLDREVSINNIGDMRLLQHNVSINHGSSGGGLFNMYGELIGITNAGNDEFYNLNYAIPFYGDNGYVNIVGQLLSTYNALNKNFGYVTGRWNLGITIQNMQTAVHGSYVNIISVVAGGNSTNKLLVNDRILSVKFNYNGKGYSYSAKNNSELAYALSQASKYLVSGKTEPDVVTIVVYRSNVGQQDIQIPLTEQLIFCDTGIYN